MGTQTVGPLASRLRPGLIVALVATVALTATGCRHRRSALRPIYSGPGVPATVGSGPVLVEDEAIPSRTTPPRIMSSDVDLGPDPDPIRTPARPPIDSEVAPSRGVSPPAPGPADEPGLLVPTLPDATQERAPSSNITPPPLTGPNASRGGFTTRQASVVRTRLRTLRDGVRDYVNDPDDLFEPAKADRPWKYVVLHHSANASGSYDEIDREHRKIQGWDGCGYHFVIGNGTGSPDGQIEVARRWSNQKHGLHVRNGKTPEVNEYGIGICLIGDVDAQKPTPKQVAAARALVAYLSERYEIPAASVGTHADLASSPTACPGKLFPREAILGTGHLAAN